MEPLNEPDTDLDEIKFWFDSLTFKFGKKPLPSCKGPNPAPGSTVGKGIHIGGCLSKGLNIFPKGDTSIERDTTLSVYIVFFHARLRASLDEMRQHSCLSPVQTKNVRIKQCGN